MVRGSNYPRACYPACPDVINWGGARILQRGCPVEKLWFKCSRKNVGEMENDLKRVYGEPALLHWRWRKGLKKSRWKSSTGFPLHSVVYIFITNYRYRPIRTLPWLSPRDTGGYQHQTPHTSGRSHGGIDVYHSRWPEPLYSVIERRRTSSHLIKFLELFQSLVTL